MMKRKTFRVATTGAGVLSVAIAIGFAALSTETASARRCTRSLATSFFECSGKLKSNLRKVGKLRDPVTGRSSVDVVSSDSLPSLLLFGPTGDPIPRDDSDFDIILFDSLEEFLFVTPANAFGDFDFDIERCNVILIPLTSSLGDAVALQVFRILEQEGLLMSEMDTVIPTIEDFRFKVKVINETPESRSVTFSFVVKYSVEILIVSSPPISTKGTVSFRGRGEQIGSP